MAAPGKAPKGGMFPPKIDRTIGPTGEKKDSTDIEKENNRTAELEDGAREDEENPDKDTNPNIPNETDILAELEAEEELSQGKNEVQAEIDGDTKILRVRTIQKLPEARVVDTDRNVRARMAFTVRNGTVNNVQTQSVIPRKTKRNMRCGNFTLNLEQGKRCEVPVICLEHLTTHGFL